MKKILCLLTVLFIFAVGVSQAADPVRVDFTKDLGPMKPLHGINNSPVRYGEPIKELKEAGIPYCRLHDTAGAFGGTHFVDIPNVFPNFDADPSDPAAYDFAFTDAYLKSLTSSGMEPFYRLGVTIENHHKIKAYEIHPPKDYQKFARICEGIVRHYNEGWANGFKYNLQYWEIWNEPENPPMWTGSMEQYFELYRVTSNHLKKNFPNIKVGGYASCGFYAVNRPSMKKNKFYGSFLTWYDSFLKFVTDSKTKSPLDFFSWHLYTSDPEEIIVHANYVAQKLKEYKLDQTEIIFDEWNYMSNNPQNRFDAMKEMPGAAFVAAAFCLMQPSPIDKAMYYDALPTRSYGGLYYFPSEKVSKTYYSFFAYNVLYQLGTCVKSSAGSNAKLYTLAAKNKEGKKAVYLVNNSDKPIETGLEITGGDLKNASVKLLDKDHLLTPCSSALKTADDRKETKLALPPLSLLLIVFDAH